MKKIIQFLLCTLTIVAFSVSSASAIDYGLETYWDVKSDFGVPDGDTLTSPFYELGYKANTTSYQYDTNGDGNLTIGDKFVDYGNAWINSLTSDDTTADDENLNIDYQVTFVWTDLEGQIHDITPGGSTDTVSTIYTGGTLDFYLDYMDGSTPPFSGGTSNSYDGPADFDGSWAATDDSGFTGGYKVATVEIDGGDGANTFTAGSLEMLTGSFNLYGHFTFIQDGFWYNTDGVELEDSVVNLSWVVGFTSGENNPANFDQTITNVMGPDGVTPLLYTIDSDHALQMEFSIVPEPTTLVLFGIGLLGFAGITRRKYS